MKLLKDKGINTHDLEQADVRMHKIQEELEHPIVPVAASEIYQLAEG